jgi:hypothetical protein
VVGVLRDDGDVAGTEVVEVPRTAPKGGGMVTSAGISYLSLGEALDA